MRVVYLGSGDIGLPVLRSLLGDPRVELVGVVTQPDRPSGRGLQVRPGAIKELASQNGVPVLQPPRVRDAQAVAEISALRPDLFVVMAYGQILPQNLLDLPRLGALNLHASLLPRHRGAAPVHAAILAGDETSGITVMWMDAGLDTGDILLGKTCPIDPAETAGSLHDKLAALAPAALSEALDLLRSGRAPRTKQDPALATYAPKLTRSLGAIDWSRRAADLERTVRGLHPWPGSTAELEMADGRRVPVKVHRAAATGLPADPAHLRFACAGGGVLELLEVQTSGGRRMSGGEFARGHRVAGLVAKS